jgi:hypothetical protein
VKQLKEWWRQFCDDWQVSAMLADEMEAQRLCRLDKPAKPIEIVLTIRLDAAKPQEREK